MFQNVVVGWVARRVPELVGLITMLVTLYNSLPANHQETIVSVLTGQGGGLTVSAVIGLAIYVWSQILSFRATVKPQVVTTDGQKITPKPDSVAQGRIEVQAKAAPVAKTILERFVERITGK